ncbi:MAG TPA: RNA methyltransferase [Bauldia sp.]|nr:RNA methyltransferase [Bauldia sp.]
MRQPSPPTPLSPAIILVAPQLGENIGTAARAMANFGLAGLRLVNPREGWPNKKAHAAASGADGVIEQVRTYATVADAVADLGFVYATTARAREVAKPVVGPREAAANIRALAREGTQAGVMFGPERTGLTNEDLSFADEILTYPVDPGFPSLNLAQAVLLFAYEWRLAGFAPEERALPLPDPRPKPAPKAELIRLFEHLESALDEAGFFRPPEKRPHMVEALRSMLQRAGLSEQEVRTLRGVVTALERRPTRPRKLADGTVTTERGKGKA